MTPQTHMFRKEPDKINSVPLQWNSLSKKLVSGGKTIVPKPAPLAARPSATVLFFSNQNAMDTTAVTNVKHLPIPPMMPNVTYIAVKEFVYTLIMNPEVQTRLPNIVMYMHPYLFTKALPIGPKISTKTDIFPFIIEIMN